MCRGGGGDQPYHDKTALDLTVQINKVHIFLFNSSVQSSRVIILSKSQ